MKNTIFLMLLALSLQGFAQIKSGVYTSDETWVFKWDDQGYEDDGILMDEEPFFIEFNDYGFRLYMQEGDVGEMFPAMYVKSMDGWDIYCVHPDERMEYKDGHMVWFYDFNSSTGYYNNSTEFKNMKRVK
jgi:hypothetical protein